MRLRHKDWKKLFGAVAQLYSDFEPETLEDRALAAAKGLVPGEMPAFNFFKASGMDTREYWHEPDSLPTRNELEIFLNVAHDHPFFSEVFEKDRRNTMTIGDFLSPAEFRATAIYNEFYRLFSIHHQMSVALSVEDNLVATCSISRNSKDFTDEERLMFDLIAPHMANAIRNGRKLRRLLSVEANLSSILEAKTIGVIALSKNGTIEYISEFARRLMEKYFGHREFRHPNLPEELRSRAGTGDSNKGAVLISTDWKFVRRLRESTLIVSLNPGGDKNETILLLEETHELSPVDLSFLGMTKRQTEVLFWISKGKTDKEIAAMLEISPRTVHKHTEAIYAKLGVETRTAAVISAQDALKRFAPSDSL